MSAREMLALAAVIATLSAGIVGVLAMVGYVEDNGDLGIAHRWCFSLAPDYPQPPTVMPPDDLGGGY